MHFRDFESVIKKIAMIPSEILETNIIHPQVLAIVVSELHIASNYLHKWLRPRMQFKTV